MTTEDVHVVRYQVCGIPIAAVDPSAASSLIVRAALSSTPYEVHLCNAYTLSLVDQDAQLAAALATADLNLPDGAPVAWFGRRSGTRGPVRGPSLLRDVIVQGQEHGLSHFFYGGAPGINELLIRNLKVLAPDFIVAGTDSPAFGPIGEPQIEEASARINASGASIVWVGLGTPKQDYAVPLLARHTRTPAIPVGAAFDFWAGRVKAAPHWMQGTGLEWTHRLAIEPRRLWRRYLLGNPRFLYSAFKHSRGQR